MQYSSHWEVKLIEELYVKCENLNDKITIELSKIRGFQNFLLGKRTKTYEGVDVRIQNPILKAAQFPKIQTSYKKKNQLHDQCWLI